MKLKHVIKNNQANKSPAQKLSNTTDSESRIQKIILTSRSLQSKFYQGQISEKSVLEHIKDMEAELNKIKSNVETFVAAKESETDREPIQDVSWLDIIFYELQQMGYQVVVNYNKSGTVDVFDDPKGKAALRNIINDAINRRIMAAFSWYICKTDTLTSVRNNRNGRKHRKGVQINPYKKAAIDRSALIAAFRDVFDSAGVAIPPLADKMAESLTFKTIEGSAKKDRNKPRDEKTGDDGKRIMIGTQKKEEEVETYGVR